jgi:sn-glycerol 3-phosphate transport system substrate-binding protein
MARTPLEGKIMPSLRITSPITRRITRRNLLGLLAVSPVLASLAVACGPQAPTTTAKPADSVKPAEAAKPAAAGGASGQAAATAKPATQAAPAAANGNKIKVRFWYGLGGQIGEVIVGQINKFNAAQNAIEVEGVLQQSYDGVQEKFLATLVGGDVPELVQVEIHATPQFASAGALAPMEQFFKDDASFNFDDLVPATLLNQRWEGTLFAMPINRSTPLLYYNKNLFKEAGLDPEKPPKTWTEFKSIGKTLTKIEGGEAKVAGFLPAADWWPFESMVWSNGGELLDKDLKKVTFAERGAPVMQIWGDMAFQDKSALVMSGQTAGDLRAQAFIDGRGAFLVNSTAGLGRFIRDVKSFEIGTAFLPYSEGSSHAVPTGGAAAAIPAKAAPEKQKAAFEFIKWWISTEQGAFWSQNTGYFPIRKSSIELLTQQGYYRDRPQFKTTIDQLQYAREAPLTPHWPAIAKEITKSMEEILVNNVPAAQSLAKAQERAQAIVNG